MPKIEISYNALYEIIQAELIESYRAVRNDIRQLTSRNDLKDHEKIDLIDFQEYQKGFEILLKYYVYRPDAEKIIEEENKNDES